MEFYILAFFANLSLMEFQVRYLALFRLFSMKSGSEWFLTGSIHENAELMLEFSKALFLDLHFSYNRLITFLMMLSVILLSVSNLIYETFWTGVGNGLLILMLEKLNGFHLAGLIRKNHHLIWWSLLSLLNWIGALTLSLLLKLPPRKVEWSLNSFYEVSFS